jgi:hypothetical protein
VSVERYPEDTHTDVEDFRTSGWKAALASATPGYSGIWHALSTAARDAIQAGQPSRGKVLWLLADAASMMLKPESVNEPFKPFAVMQGRRSALPEDFKEIDIELFSHIAAEIDNVWLRARLADLVWLLRRPRDPKFALLAIDAYRTLPLDHETWFSDGEQCWERAVRLALVLRGGATDRLKEMETLLLGSVERGASQDGFLPLSLARLLAETGLGGANLIGVARRLEELAQIFDTEGDLHKARDYFAQSAAWFRKAKDIATANRLTVCVAETWVKEALVRASSAQPSHMVAAAFFERAIHTFRSIPRAERAVHKVDERISELRSQMNVAAERSLGEMGVVTSGPVDITELVDNARNAVTGKGPVEALTTFANIHRGARVTRLRSQSEEMLRQRPLQALISATHVSRDGRVIARRPGMSLSDPNAEENSEAIWSEMVKHYSMEIGLVVRGSIWPSLEVLCAEHRLRENDFIEMANRSPIVPEGRERLFGKALFLGYDKDFVAAVHLLVPQIEHMVRWHLKARNVKTTTIDSSGIENENGLSALVDAPETQQVFGEDLAFELKALFCDPFGANLRNELAHGLLSYEACESVFGIYAWWLGLRIVFNTFLGTNTQPPPPETDGDPRPA